MPDLPSTIKIRHQDYEEEELKLAESSLCTKCSFHLFTLSHWPTEAKQNSHSPITSNSRVGI